MCSPWKCCVRIGQGTLLSCSCGFPRTSLERPGSARPCVGAMHHDARRHVLQGQGLVYFERRLAHEGVHCTLMRRGEEGDGYCIWYLVLCHLARSYPLGGSWAPARCATYTPPSSMLIGQYGYFSGPLESEVLHPHPGPPLLRCNPVLLTAHTAPVRLRSCNNTKREKR